MKTLLYRPLPKHGHHIRIFPSTELALQSYLDEPNYWTREARLFPEVPPAWLIPGNQGFLLYLGQSQSRLVETILAELAPHHQE